MSSCISYRRFQNYDDNLASGNHCNNESIWSWKYSLKFALKDVLQKNLNLDNELKQLFNYLVETIEQEEKTQGLPEPHESRDKEVAFNINKKK